MSHYESLSLSDITFQVFMIKAVGIDHTHMWVQHRAAQKHSQKICILESWLYVLFQVHREIISVLYFQKMLVHLDPHVLWTCAQFPSRLHCKSLMPCRRGGHIPYSKGPVWPFFANCVDLALQSPRNYYILSFCDNTTLVSKCLVDKD